MRNICALLDYKPKSRLTLFAQKSPAHFAERGRIVGSNFDAIRDWALLRYHARKSSEYRKGARVREKMETPKPSHRATSESAENLNRHE